MKTITTIIGFMVAASSFGQQRMITYDSLNVETSNVLLSNPLSMSAHYDETTTEVVISSTHKDGSVTNDKYLVKGITSTDSFKIYHLKDEKVLFEVIIGEGYFLLEYGDHHDVFPQNK